MAEEETGTLDKLLNVVQNFKSKEQTGDNKGGWIVAAIVAILALIAVAIFAWQQWKAGKERAKLLHEQAVHEEGAHQAAVDAIMEEDQLAKKAALKRARELLEEADRLNERATELEAERLSARAAIDKISSWEDVDAIVR